MGAFAGGTLWTALQYAGMLLADHQLRGANGVYGVMLGLLAWIYLDAEATMYAAEVSRRGPGTGTGTGPRRSGPGSGGNVSVPMRTGSEFEARARCGSTTERRSSDTCTTR